MIIYAYPDGSWQYKEELPEHEKWSEDLMQIILPDDCSHSDVDDYVYDVLGLEVMYDH